MNKLSRNQRGYTAVEALLIFVALAIVAGVAWYVHTATTNTNKTYSIHESSQKPGTPKKNVTNKATTTTPSTSGSSSTSTGQ